MDKYKYKYDKYKNKYNNLKKIKGGFLGGNPNSCNFDKTKPCTIYHFSEKKLVNNKIDYNNDNNFLYDLNDNKITYEHISMKNGDDNEKKANTIMDKIKDAMNKCDKINYLFYFDLFIENELINKNNELINNETILTKLNNKLNELFNDNENKYKNIIILNNTKLVSYSNYILDINLIQNNIAIENIKNGNTFKKIINLHRIYNKIYGINSIHEKYDKKFIIRFYDDNKIIDEKGNEIIDNSLSHQEWFKLYFDIPSCSDKRLRQFSGTCWLNSVLNSLFLNDELFNLIEEHNKIELNSINLNENELRNELIKINYFETEIDILYYLNIFIEIDKIKKIKESKINEIEIKTKITEIYNKNNVINSEKNYDEYNKKYNDENEYNNKFKKLFESDNTLKENDKINFYNKEKNDFYNYFKKIFNSNINDNINNYKNYENDDIFFINLINNFIDIYKKYKINNDNINNFNFINLINDLLNNEKNDNDNKLLVYLICFILKYKFIIFLKYLEIKNYKLNKNDDNLILVLSSYIQIAYKIFNKYGIINISIIGSTNDLNDLIKGYSEYYGIELITYILLNKNIKSENFNSYNISNNDNFDEKILIKYNNDKDIDTNNKIEYNVNNIINNINDYKLITGVLQISKYHAVSVFICNNKYYLYDSNNHMFEFDWLYINDNNDNYNFYNNLIKMIDNDNFDCLDLLFGYLNNDVLKINIDYLNYLIYRLNNSYKNTYDINNETINETIENIKDLIKNDDKKDLIKKYIKKMLEILNKKNENNNNKLELYCKNKDKPKCNYGNFLYNLSYVIYIKNKEE